MIAEAPAEIGRLERMLEKTKGELFYFLNERARVREQAPVAFVWENIGTGNCTGKDELPYTDGSAVPDDKRAKEGHTAVCWDNVSHINEYRREVFCTYKAVQPDTCLGESGRPEVERARGVMYRAVRRR